MAFNDTDYPNMIAGTVAGTILLIFTFILRRDYTQKRDFSVWIIDNMEQIVTLGSEYNGIPVDQDTRFVQYEVCVSIGIFSYRRKTGYYVKEYHFTAILNLMFTAFTFVFGWWSIPFGPIETIRAISHNISVRSKSIDTVINEIMKAD